MISAYSFFPGMYFFVFTKKKTRNDRKCLQKVSDAIFSKLVQKQSKLIRMFRNKQNHEIFSLNFLLYFNSWKNSMQIISNLKFLSIFIVGFTQYTIVKNRAERLDVVVFPMK